MAFDDLWWLAHVVIVHTITLNQTVQYIKAAVLIVLVMFTQFMMEYTAQKVVEHLLENIDIGLLERKGCGKKLWRCSDQLHSGKVTTEDDNVNDVK